MSLGTGYFFRVLLILTPQSRGYLLAMFRIVVPRLHHGTVFFLPAGEVFLKMNNIVVCDEINMKISTQSSEDDEEVELPCLDSPVPASWHQLDGPFHNVYAIKQVRAKNTRIFYFMKNV